MVQGSALPSYENAMNLRTELELHGPFGLHEMAIAWTGRVRGEAGGQSDLTSKSD